MAERVIILTDPGQDQAAAILMMLGAPEVFEVLGLVATAGNIDLAHTLRNCLKLLELTGCTDIPVFAGCPRPIRRPLVMAEHVHGPTGLDGPDLPEPWMSADPRHGVRFIIETILANPPDTITIVSLSPLTNLAMALIEAPEITGRIRRVVAMAGAYFEVGNITPTAEFNVYVDPEAADIVLRAGLDLTLLPLDVTHKMLSTPQRLGAFAALGNRCGPALAEMLRFSEAFDLRKYGWEGAPLHGPCVPAYMMAPDIFSGRRINVSVETGSELTLGMTAADWWGITERPKNVFYVRDGDPVAYYHLLTHCVGRLP
ncbi:nucleoside hydrolase [Rhizobium rhizosphaerae]|uniref:Nucleoside hydrolase n=1 Tax=Xaviernesmea rhizosphaerae TaxID=1672749 RepID=A0A1Q9AHR7_9HYPH|nr:nucleoside hydrolase [Xaviernesmea rhizosphaerae]OLP54773.1 nucleoside hydrolase [Xaviernesmea rhizosphaerae]